MTIIKGFNKTLAVVGAAMMLMVSLAGCSATKNLEAGSTWEVAVTTSLDELTIADGAVIKAPEGKSLTMTVNGIETGITPGTYTGDVVLAVTTENKIKFQYVAEPYVVRTAVFVENGKYVADKSVAAAVTGGEVTDTFARDIKITSVGEEFSGVVVTGDSNFSYSIINPVINLTGNGANEAGGFGAAIRASGKAEVTVENANIITKGAARHAVWAGGESIMKVNDSYIEVNNGTLPADYKFSIGADTMMEVPWMLGISGNCRATNVLENATAYYTNTHIKAQAWGALSTDGVIKVKLYATNSTIETVESGYGAYSIGDCLDYFSGCEFNVTDIGLIMANEEANGVFTDGTVVNSGRFGVMMHNGNVGTLTIDKKSVFNTGAAVIQLKSSYPTIVVDDAELNSKNGIILQAMVNDDPFGRAAPGGAPAGGAPAGEGPAGNAPAGRGPAGNAPAGRGPAGNAPGGEGPAGNAPAGRGPAGNAPAGRGPAGGAPGGGEPSAGGAPAAAPGGGSDSSKNIDATFMNMVMTGDIINAMTTLADMNVAFGNTTITGAITTATVEHAVGPNGEAVTMEHPELYKLIGEVTNTYCATADNYGMNVSLDGRSKWIVSNSSYLTGLEILEGAGITAPEGYKVTMSVNGARTDIRPGRYKGNIVLKVTK